MHPSPLPVGFNEQNGTVIDICSSNTLHEDILESQLDTPEVPIHHDSQYPPLPIGSFATDIVSTVASANTQRFHAEFDGSTSIKEEFEEEHFDASASDRPRFLFNLSTTPAFPARMTPFRVSPPTIADDGSQVEITVVWRSNRSYIVTVRRGRDSQQRIIRPAQPHARAGVLAPIVRKTINYDALKALDTRGELMHDGYCLLDALTDESVFLACCLGNTPVPVKCRQRLSAHMLHHLETMEKDFIVVRRGNPLLVMPMFTVPKKDPNLLRLILDCRILNELCKRPPEMNLPSIHEIIDYLMQNEWAVEVDFTSWFYQFLLGLGVQKYFGARLAGHRGRDLIDIVMLRMAQGWSWAPAIGQRSSNVLVEGLGKAWIDNLLLAALTQSELKEKVAELIRRLDAVGVEAKRETLEDPKQVMEVLGLQVDLKNKQYRLSSNFAEKVSELKLSSEMTLREIYELVGSLLWASHVCRIKLCRYPLTLDLLSSAASQVHSSKDWEQKFALSTEQLCELRSFKTSVAENEWHPWRNPASSPTVDIWSDSSNTKAAFVAFEQDDSGNKFVSAAEAWDVEEKIHIFIKELWIASRGAMIGSRGHEVLRSFIDNAAAHHCMRKGHSSVFYANILLQAVFGTEKTPKPVHVESVLVPSAEELADIYTRGVEIPKAGTSLERVQHEHIAFGQVQAIVASALRNV